MTKHPYVFRHADNLNSKRILFFTAEIPAEIRGKNYLDPETRNYYDREALELFNALKDILPCGTYDRLLQLMIEEKEKFEREFNL